MADFAFFCTRERNKAFGRFLDPVTLDDHQVIALPFAPAARNQFSEVAITLGIHRQQGHAAERAIFIGTGQPDVSTANRLDTAAHGRFIELHQRAHIAHIGNRYRRHSGCRHRLDQWFDPHQPVDQGKLGVQTQVDERSGHGSPIQNAKTTRQGLYNRSSARQALPGPG